MLNLDFDSNNVFFRCVEDSTEAIMICSIKGDLIYVNPAWEALYGYSQEEALGRTPRILRSAHQTEEFYQSMWRDILDPHIGKWRGELVNRAKDGREVPVELTITPIRGNDKVIVGYMALALDQSEKKQMMAKILQQDRMASVGLLASGLAHEIGTPLGVIRGRAELARGRVMGDEGAMRNLDIIIQQIDRVAKLIRNLLNLGRGHQESGSVCDVKEVVDDSISLLAQKFREFGVEIQVEVEDGLQVKISHNQLEQVLINLLVNAIHAIRTAMEKGPDRPHCLSVKAQQSSKLVELFVSDTGCGISDKAKDLLFSPFFTTKPVGEGTGLGLSLSLQILREVGGGLSLEATALDKGTTFKITLPYKQKVHG